MHECSTICMDFRVDYPAEASDVPAEKSDVALVVTGGSPHTEILASGNELVRSAWDVTSGKSPPTGRVLLFDERAITPVLPAAELVVTAGMDLEIMTSDRAFAPEVMAMNLMPYMRSPQKRNVIVTMTFRLLKFERAEGRLRALIDNDYGAVSKGRYVDHEVISHETLPNDELCFAFKPDSHNLSAVDHDRLVASQPQNLTALLRELTAVPARRRRRGAQYARGDL